jgi:IS30 family transposase
LSQGQAIDETTKRQIQRYLKAGLSRRAIARLCHVAHSTIEAIAKEIRKDFTK